MALGLSRLECSVIADVGGTVEAVCFSISFQAAAAAARNTAAADEIARLTWRAHAWERRIVWPKKTSNRPRKTRRARLGPLSNRVLAGEWRAKGVHQ